MKIENLYPEKVFHYFSEISKIPRGSNKEKKLVTGLWNLQEKEI